MAHWLKPGAMRASDAILTALIHNVLEKEVLSEEELATRHGAWVAQAVRALTQDRALMRTSEGRKTYYARLALMDPEVKALKYFDKFDNVFAVCLNPDPAAREGYVKEIEHYIRPIGNALVPELSGYFEEMIREARAIGHYRPVFSPS
jgi:(p)ppGpp synthase/HD superfamily hydrolase